MCFPMHPLPPVFYSMVMLVACSILLVTRVQSRASNLQCVGQYLRYSVYVQGALHSVLSMHGVGTVCMVAGYGMYGEAYGTVWMVRCMVRCVWWKGTGGLGPFLQPPLTSSPIPPIHQMTRVKSTLNKPF